MSYRVVCISRDVGAGGEDVGRAVASQLGFRYVDEEIVRRVARLAELRGVPRAQIALAWMLSKPVVTAPLVGATRIGHIDDAVAALDVTLTDDEIAALERPYTPRPIVGFA